MTNSAMKPILHEEKKSKTNYLNLPADQTVGLRKSMSDYQASMAVWGNELISQAKNFDRMAESRNKELWELLPRQGSALYLWNEKRKQAKQLDEDYIELTTEGTETRRKENAYIFGLNGLLQEQEAVKRRDANATIAEAERLGLKPDPSDKELVKKSAKYHGTDRSVLTQFTNEYPGFFKQAASTHEFKGIDGRWYTLNQAQGDPENWELGLRSIRELAWIKALELSDNKLLLRQIVLPGFRKQDEVMRTARLRVAEETYNAREAIEEKHDLAENLTRDPVEEFRKELIVVSGKYPTANGFDGRAATIEMAERTSVLLEEGLIGETEAEAILNWKIPSNMHPAQDKKSSKTFSELNPAAARQIEAALRKQKKEVLDNKETDIDNEVRSTFFGWKEKIGKRPITVKDLQEYRKLHRDKFGSFTPLPDDFTKIETAQDQDSAAALTDLKHYMMTGGRNYKTAQGLRAGITDPDDFEAADKILDYIESQGMDTDRRDEFVKQNTNEYTNETIGRFDIGSERWSNTYDNLIDIYNDAYSDAIDANQSASTAEGKGREAVKRAIREDKAKSAADKTLGVFKPEEWDDSAATDLKKTKVALKKDRTILSKNTPMPGEEAALKQAESFYEYGGPPVPYYVQIAEIIPGMNWKQVMDKRWELSGGKAKRTDLEEVVNKLSPEDQRLINQNNPSATLRLLLKNTEFAETFNIDSQENPDYNYIRAEGGEGPIETEMPLTQMTVSQVLELAKTGHHDIGVLGLDGLQLVEALEGIREDWDLDTVFDEEFQNKLIKGALRTKANKQNAVSGVDTAWMSLTNINENLASAWIDTTGIKDPYRQPNTMPEAVAMAAVDFYLPDMA